jgi:N6-L-threonylcarbamoyladenine synthase
MGTVPIFAAKSAKMGLSPLSIGNVIFPIFYGIVRENRTVPFDKQKIPVNILALETTCDETAAAVVTDRLEALSSVVASQDDLHRRFGGVVPEIASRAHVERILPVIDESLRKAGMTLKNIDAVAVANTPGLAGSLLVGLMAAKAICLALDIPLVAINHLQAHIYACRLAADEEVFPCVGLIVSGGHTSLYRCRDALEFDLLGSTIDDAAGEAFDKVAAMLGLPFPGGPSVALAAEGGNPKAYNFPRAFLNDDDRLDFSFSGLKTAVRYAIAGPGKTDFADLNLSVRQIADLAASFQEAVVDCLVGKAFAALRKTGMRVLCVGGGVAANARLRQRLTEESSRQTVRLHVAPLNLCTDNAVMGAIAVERLKAGCIESLDLDVHPGLIRPVK